MPDAPRIGLVLGSGGARGWAHVGVLEVLREHGIRPAVTVGTSIGAVMGAFSAAGRLDALRAYARSLDIVEALSLFLEPGIHHDGLLRGARAMKKLRSFLETDRIEALSGRYAAVATDLATGDPVVLDRGSLLDAIRASISIPGVFTPVRHDGRTLVDGGLASPVPIATARALGADFVIAVNVLSTAPCPYRTRNTQGLVEQTLDVSERVWHHLCEAMPALGRLAESRSPHGGFVDVLVQTMRLAETKLAADEILRTPPDALVEPAVADIPILDFARAEDAIRAGRDAAERMDWHRIPGGITA